MTAGLPLLLRLLLLQLPAAAVWPAAPAALRCAAARLPRLLRAAACCRACWCLLLLRCLLLLLLPPPRPGHLLRLLLLLPLRLLLLRLQAAPAAHCWPHRPLAAVGTGRQVARQGAGAAGAAGSAASALRHRETRPWLDAAATALPARCCS